MLYNHNISGKVLRNDICLKLCAVEINFFVLILVKEWFMESFYELHISQLDRFIVHS